jgi:hypothetical protein
MTEPLNPPSARPPSGSPQNPSRSEMVEEMKTAPYEPLLPIEKKLISYSLGIGLVLLGILVWFSRSVVETSPLPARPISSVSK